MESENVIKNMNFLTINFLRKVDCNEFQFLDEKAKSLLKKFCDEDEESNDNEGLADKEKIEIFNQIIQIVRDQLKQSSTVGQILDIMKFSVKMLVVEKGGGDGEVEGNIAIVTTDDVLLLNDIFQLLPEQWSQDPVKVHLITKAIIETLDGDFNNTMHVLTKIIVVNRLGFYVALTLFWALYLSFFEKDSHHYYKMYDRTKFFKLLNLSEGKEYDFDKIFKLLLLISIYQNYVLLNNDPLPSHETFQEFFKVSSSSTSEKDLGKLKTYLMNLKTLIERSNRVSLKQNTDALMLLEFLELDLIKGISDVTSLNDNKLYENLDCDDLANREEKIGNE